MEWMRRRSCPARSSAGSPTRRGASSSWGRAGPGRFAWPTPRFPLPGSTLVTASGMSALTAFLLGGLHPGDHLVAGQDLYGATVALLREQAPRWGIAVTLIDAAEAGLVEAALRPTTRAIFVEAVSNPLLRL